MTAHSSGRSTTAVAGVRIRAPMMAINTVAAGGGSVLHFDGSRYQVGPDSAGAAPGPACYRGGGPLTVTDANVMVGKIQPAHFPAIFGGGADQRLDADIVRAKVRRAGAGPGRARGGGGVPAHRRRQHGQRDQAGLAREGARRRPLRPAVLRRRRRAARLPGGRRARHGDGVHPPVRRRAVGLRHGAGGPGGAARAGGGACAGRRHLGPGGGRRPAGRRGGGGAGGPGRRSGRDAGVRYSRRRSAERRVHVRYAGTQAALEVPLGPDVREAFTAAHRASGSASPHRSAGWSWKRSRWRPRRPASRCGSRRWPSGPAPGRTRWTRSTIWTGGAEHRHRCSSARRCWRATGWPARR